jgi:hypothetical protein
VRKLHAELAEITRHAAEILREHQVTTGKKLNWRQRMAARPRPQYRGIFGAPAW